MLHGWKTSGLKTVFASSMGRAGTHWSFALGAKPEKRRRPEVSQNLTMHSSPERDPAARTLLWLNAATGTMKVPFAAEATKSPVATRFSYKGEDVVLTLERICKSFGYPKAVRVDQGSEFISRDPDLCAYQNGVVLDFSRLGKPTDNCFIESFNGKLRAECLNTHWFMSLDDARAKMEEWRRDYNEIRQHSAIGNKPPISLLNAPPASPPA